MNTISKEFHFSASHVLNGLEENHPCGVLHGHNYVVRVFLQGEPDESGFVVDYRKLQPIKEYIDTFLDHKHLNDVYPFQTTVENMTCHLFHLWKMNFPQLVAIEMRETPKTCCRYEPTDTSL
jgi:6-pyruvoyltetrahydropterin/6-carboxytetrahydropterin synthase